MMVALRKESVDRNETGKGLILKPIVALRKESVDRNIYFKRAAVFQAASLSARRAWIEIIDWYSVRQVCDSRSPQGERG